MKKAIIFILSFIVIAIVIVCIWFNSSLGGKSGGKKITITVSSGSTVKGIITELGNKKIIANSNTCYFYAKMNKVNNLQAGTYELKEGYGCKNALALLAKGDVIDDSITLQFIEGKRLKNYAKVISNKYSYTEEEIIEKWQDKKYLKKLIDKYWFLTDEILDDNIYYALEGYLYPDTYKFRKDSSIEEITEKLLSTMGSYLKEYEKKYSTLHEKVNTIHKVLTLASIIELEGANSNDREGIASVFFNRLDNGWSLGSDVTTYYAAQIDFSDRDLYQKEIEEVNAYNTRPEAMAGKLPIGPISNPSIKSIKAVFEHPTTDYFYFVADKNGKTYFTKTYSEHAAIVQDLKNKGLWYEYK